MRTFRKILGLFLAIAMLFTLSVSIFADETTPHTITVENPDATETHTYTAYQVFKGTWADNVLSHIEWGDGVDGDGILAALAGNPAFAGCTTAADVAKVLEGFANGSEELRAFGAIVDANLATPAGSADATATENAVINVVGDGYYYVKDTSANLEQDTYSDYILLVEGDVTVTAKDTSGVVSYKKVKDVNDSYAHDDTNPTGWQDSADYDIGDEVPFQLNGTVAADYDKYTTYKTIFHDVESEGLTFKAVTGVFVDGVEITSGFTVNTNPTDGCTFEVIFEDLKSIPEVKGGSLITVEYVSTLNDDAVIGVPGNPNVMYMEYSNNPTDETSTGTTKEDKVVVFTYEVIINKVDENGNPLTGAAFELYKWVIDEEYPEGHWVLVPGEVNGASSTDGDGAITTINGKTVTYIPDAENVEYYKITDRPNENSPLTDIYLKATDVEAVAAAVANGLSLGVPYYEMRNGQIVKVQGNFSYTINSLERATSAGTKFTWKGIDDGIYKLVETVTPPKYNPIADIEFEVTAEHEILSEDPQLLDAIGQGEHIVFNPTDANIGILESTIVNEQGATLPSTGGIGTTIFYVLGALMVLSAGIFLVIRKFARGQV